MRFAFGVVAGIVSTFAFALGVTAYRDRKFAEQWDRQAAFARHPSQRGLRVV